ncbi:MAG TPA: MBL fold metallo-hydrolase [Bacteroidales bacterium]|nr:MBL fold metallo-hydrolase [Bacteroidales bacterium]
MKFNFCSLSSGSSGNCYYIGNEFHGFLIDAGISAGSVKKFLKRMNISMQSIMGILITHNHSDHIKGLEVLTRKNHIPVFTTFNVWNSILSNAVITSDCRRDIKLKERFHLAGFDIEAFPVCHDAPETVGFHISYGSKIMTVVTDLGHICETTASYIIRSNILVIESNYDENMLMTGKYPYFLKQRIHSDHGHLGNNQTSDYLAEIFSDKLSHICLAHLSRNNNTPDLAMESLKNTFSKRNISLAGHQTITVLNRSTPTEMITIDC